MVLLFCLLLLVPRNPKCNAQYKPELLKSWKRSTYCKSSDSPAPNTNNLTKKMMILTRNIYSPGTLFFLFKHILENFIHFLNCTGLGMSDISKCTATHYVVTEYMQLFAICTKKDKILHVAQKTCSR